MKLKDIKETGLYLQGSIPVLFGNVLNIPKKNLLPFQYIL